MKASTAELTGKMMGLTALSDVKKLVLMSSKMRRLGSLSKDGDIAAACELMEEW